MQKTEIPRVAPRGADRPLLVPPGLAETPWRAEKPRVRGTKTMATARGFTFLEVVLALFLVAAAAAIIVPWSFSDRIVAQEDQAIAGLRRIATAQEAFKASENGSYGFLLELLGYDLGRPIDVKKRLDGFSVVNGLASAEGYHFTVYLAGQGGAGALSPEALVPEHAGTFWVAYAWPIAYGVSGRRVFGVNARGEIFAFENPVKPLSGSKELPAANLLGNHLGKNPLADAAPWIQRLNWIPTALPE